MLELVVAQRPILEHLGDIGAPLLFKCVASILLGADVGPNDRVLDVGTGCGYQAAVLAALAREVVSIEIRPSLATDAGARLRKLGIANLEVRVGDGSLGVPQRGPFDVVVAAAGTIAPPPGRVYDLFGPP